jgi:hypothetical protein
VRTVGALAVVHYTPEQHSAPECFGKKLVG